MNNSIIPISRKELARFFSNKTSAAIAILLPGVLLFAMWSLMGNALNSMFEADEEEQMVIAAVNMPESMRAVTQSSNMEVKDIENIPETLVIQEEIGGEEYRAVAVFPEGFDAAVAAYDPAGGGTAPQVEVYYDSTDKNSMFAYTSIVAMLDAYESSLANKFDVNMGETAYDVSDEQSRAGAVIVSIVPMVLLILLFSGCMSIAAESIAGEKERGTMTTLLATPIKRRDIALGKILALTLIGLMIAASSAIGLFASLPNLTQGEVAVNIYGPTEYGLLALVILATTLLIVMMIALVSALAKTTKEAQMYLTPLMIVVMVVGLMGMFGNGAQTETAYYLLPLYNSVQCMIGIFTFDFQPLHVVVCIVSNLVYTGIGVMVLQRMFHSERLMFAR